MNDSTAINDKTDYYELFGVEETASQDQLKKAYRKAAMKWHPDRNHINVEEATRVFQIIEHAYSILSDPHERAWYDGHRHVVINEFGEFDATNVDIEGLFGAGAYSGFNDGPNGFYTVFRKAFQELGEEEKSATKIPQFGDSNSAYENVAEFYNFWTCFVTKRSFAFKDIYRLKDAPNARYKRAMNQENEKVRQKAQREFVQSVRELALFAKKRDPRVKKHLEEVEKQNEEKRKLAEMKKLERQREVEKQLESILNDNSNPISYNENDIIYLKEFDNEETEPQWHCDYCGRDMNTESAFKQHCNTKKHKKLSASARKDFLADPSLFEHTKYTFMLLGLTDYEIEEITGKPADMFFGNQSQTESKDDIETEEEEIKEEFNKKGKQNKKQNQNNKNKNKNKNKNAKNKNKNDDDDDDNDDDTDGKVKDDIDDDDDDDFQPKNGKNKNNKNQNNNQGKKGKGKNNQNQNQQNNQQKINKKEKHKLKMQRQKEAKEKAELEELEKQKQKQREEKEKIESIISKSQSSDIFTENSNENENNDNETQNNEKEETQNFGPKLSKKEKKRLRQLEEARKRFLIQDEEEEEEKAEKEEEKEKENQNENENENLPIEEEEKDENEPENETNSTQNQETTIKVAKKEEKTIMIVDENGNKVKVTMTDNFDDENEVKDEDEQDQDKDQNQNQNQNQNQKNQGGQPKGKNKNKKGPKKAPPGMFMCRKCHAVFPSKTKLFKHLEETNHATAYG